MKKTIISLIVIVIALIAAYLYSTRPVGAPSQDIGEASAKLPAGSAISDTYRIGTGSSVEFSIYELLRGKDKTVIGFTPDIGGDIRISDGVLEFGDITISARTWKTDSTQRDGAIARFILKSDKPENEFITWKPVSVSITSGSLEEGQDFSFSASGDLTISGVTKPAAFVGTARISGGALSGTASAKLKRSDFNLVVPNLDFIANIPDEFSVSVTVSAQKMAI